MPRRNWLITGVSSGFGRIMTEQLLARGDRTARALSVGLNAAWTDVNVQPKRSP
jgi:NAD(P)-dependent dehydrogenase (short-subunit alcohol dehydrogenase family)